MALDIKSVSTIRFNQRLKRLIIFIFSSFILCSCAFLGLDKVDSKSISSKNESLSPSRMPFKLEVVDEVNDGDRLHILGAVSAQTAWSLDEVVVRLTGIQAGSIVGLSYLALAKITDNSESISGSDQIRVKMIKPGERHQFSLSIPAKNITDYQLELLWGKEARDYLGSVSTALSGNIELRRIEVETTQEPCTVMDCGVSYKISAEIFNGTDSAISKTLLGVGFVRNKVGKELDLSKSIPENEEQVEVPDLNLASGASRSLRLKFDSPVPASEVESVEGTLKPRIRIISFE